ncbi:MAG: ATP-binding cassette domain-containing protein [Sellimonas intestinalis]
MGKSGSGKSTLIKLMAGILIPTEGKILLSGIDLKKIELSSLYKVSDLLCKIVFCLMIQ